jgi:hypothetical protein
MKGLTVITALFSVSILAVLVFFEAFAASTIDTIRENTPSHAVCVPALVPSADVRVAPTFDGAGAVLSDPTGTMMNPYHSECAPALVAGSAVKIAPVFDATGVIVSDPTGTILNVNNP